MKIKYYSYTIEIVSDAIRKKFPEAEPKKGMNELPSHLLWMLEEIKGMNGVSGKAGRWIGYVLCRAEEMGLLTNEKSQKIVREDVSKGLE